MRVAFASLATCHHDLASVDDAAALTRLRRTAELLAERGHDVTYCCAQWWDGADVGAFDHEGVTYRRVTRERNPRKFATKLPVTLRRVGADVIQVANSPPGVAAAAGVCGSLVRAPTVVDWWCDRDDGDPRRAVRAADAVLTPSETIRTQVREYGAAGEDVHVVPEPVDLDLVRNASMSERADVVYARHLDADANVETFLLALAELRDRTWRAAVVGDGPAREEAEATARELRIDDRVDFLGDLPIEDRVSLYKGAHVFAQTARREAFATDLLWALACGCLGVVEYQGESSAHELVEGRDRGRLVTSPQELADEIVAAADMDRWTVDDDFDAYGEDAVIEQYLERYCDAVDDYGWL